MSTSKIFTAVFSYNRPRHLDNCLQSVKDLYPNAHLVVFDDNSSDPKVRDVINKHGCEVRVGNGGTGRHGGLYDNMQMAYDEAIAGGYDYLLSLQDDLQLLRPVDERILREFDETFEKYPTVASLEVRFSRTLASPHEFISPPPSADASPVPFRDYQDVSLLNLDRLSAHDWNFNLDLHVIVSGEATLSLKMANLGLRLVRIRTSFVMHVPFPDLFRNRLRLPRLSGIRRDIFRYAYMSDAAIERMDARPEGEIAQWRDYLEVADTSWFDRWLLSSKNDAKIMQ